MLLRGLLTVFMMLLFGACRADDSMLVKYAGFDFSIPANPSVVATRGDGTSGNILIFKYDSEKNGYIALINISSDPTWEEMEDGLGCDFAVFIEDLVTRKDDTACNRKPLEAFYEDLENSDYGSWFGADGNKLFYIVESRESNIYLVAPDGTLIQIASDLYGDEKDLKSIVMPIVK